MLARAKLLVFFRGGNFVLPVPSA